MMITKIQRWGHSLGMRIPKTLAEGMGLTSGTPVELEVENGRLVITPSKKCVYDLGTLLEGITRDNLHGEVDWGPAVGREVW